MSGTCQVPTIAGSCRWIGSTTSKADEFFNFPCRFIAPFSPRPLCYSYEAVVGQVNET